jgi:DNA-binding NarL/FixJ family response regulator
MPALALTSDLMMQSQVSGAAQRAGVDLVIVSNVDALVTQATAAAPEMVIVDLSHPGIDPAALMEQLQPLLSPDTATLAFGPHVHKGLLAAATEAGFGSVISRGQFHANMVMILASVKT